MSLIALPHRATARRRAAVVVVTTVLVFASGLVSTPALADAATGQRAAARAADDEVVLPTRVAAAISRTERALDRTEDAIDDGDPTTARRSMRAVILNLRRAYRAGIAQMNAAPVDEEAETTPGPDSVIAVLGLDQLTITRVGSMFDEVTTVAVVAGLNSTARTAAGLRARMLKLVVALDPEGAGADYGDGMADTVDAYADEVSGLREALSTDRLTPTAKAVLQAAIARSVAAQATVTAAFGGGE